MKANSEEVLSALGPLAGLFLDADVIEIMVDATERVLVERDGRLEESSVRFESLEALQKVIDGLLSLNDEKPKPGETICAIHFPGSEARGVVVLPPTAIRGPHLVIRKLMNTDWIRWGKLIEFGTISQEAYEFLQRAVRVPVNILMAGGTGSGKTTVANRIAELIPDEERLVIVEKVHELQISHPRSVSLEASGRTRVAMEDLIRTGMMMRPDWLIVGELNGPEAMQAIEALAGGTAGMTLLHGNSLEDSLRRLETMCLSASIGFGLMEIRNLIAAAIQIVCYQKRLSNGKRRITDIAEIRGVENGAYLVERIFRYDEKTDRIERTGIRASWD